MWCARSALVQRTFRKLDEDGNGSVSPEELVRSRPMLGLFKDPHQEAMAPAPWPQPLHHAQDDAFLLSSGVAGCPGRVGGM